jgi:hypothetical protein
MFLLKLVKQPEKITLNLFKNQIFAITLLGHRVNDPSSHVAPSGRIGSPIHNNTKRQTQKIKTRKPQKIPRNDFG